MKLKEAMYLWNAGTDQIKVVPWPNYHRNNSDAYRMSGGACYMDVQKMGPMESRAKVFIDAMHIIIRDRVPAKAVHKAFLVIDEYVDGLADDMLPRDLLNKRQLKVEGFKTPRTTVDISSASRTFELESALRSLKVFNAALMAAVDGSPACFRPALTANAARRVGRWMDDLAEWLQGNPGVAAALPLDRLATLTRGELEKALYGRSDASPET